MRKGRKFTRKQGLEIQRVALTEQRARRREDPKFPLDAEEEQQLKEALAEIDRRLVEVG